MTDTTSSPTANELDQLTLGWRTRLLNAVLWIGAILVLPAIVFGAIADFQSDPAEALPRTIVYAIVYGLILLLALVHRIGFIARGSLLMLLLAAYSTYSLANGGLPGEGRIIFFLFVVLASALFGLRGGIIALAVMLVALMTHAWLFSQGLLMLSEQDMTNVHTLTSWADAIAAQVLIVAITLASFAYLFRQMTGLAATAIENANSAQASTQLASTRAAMLEEQTCRLQTTE